MSTYAGVFTRSLHHQFPAGGQPLQVHFARFVRAVLAPHHGEDSKLGEVRITPEDFPDPSVFFGRYAVVCGNLRSDF
jgi:hypothetical protein